MRFVGYIVILIFPLGILAQSATDCPTWNKKSKTSKADYFNYLSKNQGKKGEETIPYKPAPVPVTKTKHTTSTGNKSSSAFYTNRRYNLFPEEKEDVEEAENEIEENQGYANSDTARRESTKEEIITEEPKIEEVEKGSAATAVADDTKKTTSENETMAKIHKRKKAKIFSPDVKHNAVKKNRGIRKNRIDRCAKRF